jgi:hypothetical protein
VTRPLPYVNYTMPDPGGTGFYYNFDWFQRWDAIPPDPQAMYAACEFFFETGTYGYLGLQTYDNGDHRAHFSIWDTSPGSGTAQPDPATPWAVRFDHENSGTMSNIAYPFVAGREYRLRLWVLDHVAGSPGYTRWMCTVRDEVTLDETTVGVIQLTDQSPHEGYGLLQRNPGAWLECFSGDPPIPFTCEGVPGTTRVRYRGAYGNNGGFSPSIAKTNYAPVGQPPCTHANVVDGEYPSATLESGYGIALSGDTIRYLWPPPQDVAFPVFRWCPDRSSRLEDHVRFDVVSGVDVEVRSPGHPARRLVLEFARRPAHEAIEIEHFLRGVLGGSFWIRDPDLGDFFRACLDGTVRRTGDGRHKRVSLAVREVREP